MDDVLSLKVTYLGERKLLREWLASAECKVPSEVALLRVSAGWNIQRVMTTPVGEPPKKGRYSSRWRGVAWHPGNEKWSARIRDGDKIVELGYYDDEMIAAAAFNWAARRLKQDAAKVNVI